MHFVWISEQTATFALYSINRLVLYNYRWRVFTARYELNPYIKQIHLVFNPLNAELNPICYLLALLGAHHFLHVSRISVKSLTLTLLMSCIYGAPILDVSRSHTTTHHSR